MRNTNNNLGFMTQLQYKSNHYENRNKDIDDVAFLCTLSDKNVTFSYTNAHCSYFYLLFLVLLDYQLFLVIINLEYFAKVSI